MVDAIVCAAAIVFAGIILLLALSMGLMSPTPPPARVVSSGPIDAVFSFGGGEAGGPGVNLITTARGYVGVPGCGPPSGFATEYCYESVFTITTRDFRLSNFGLEVLTSVASPFPVTRISVVSIQSYGNDTTLPATCTGPICNGGPGSVPWTYGAAPGAAAFGPSTPLSDATMYLLVDMGTSDPTGLGDMLVALGEGNFTGIVTLPLP